MPVVVVVTEDAAVVLRHDRDLKGVTSQNSVAEGLRAVRELGLTFTPVYPESAGARLSRYFQANAEDRSEAEYKISQLLEMPVIEAAYWKPAEEMP